MGLNLFRSTKALFLIITIAVASFICLSVAFAQEPILAKVPTDESIEVSADDGGFEFGLADLAVTSAFSSTLDIISPTPLRPAYAGPYDNPSKIIVRVTKPADGLTSDQFTVTIGTPATVTTRYEGTDEYVLEVMPPAQSANGLYDLSVSATTISGTVSDTVSDTVYYSNTNSVDVMLVIDRSGSMGFFGYIEPAKNAAKQFVDLMNDGDMIGVASFNQSATVNYSLTTIISGTTTTIISGTTTTISGTTKTEAKDAIDPITSGGTTSIGDGLQKGQGELTSKGEPLHPWAIVLLSDGFENTPPYVADVLPGIKSTKTVIHTIALGLIADQPLMQDIAAQTGGTYNVSPGAQELSGVYNTIAGAVTGQQILVSLTGIIQQGATDEKSVVIDSTVGQATFSLSWSPNCFSSLDLTLEDPNGNAIDTAVAASNPDVDYVQGMAYAYYRVISPTLAAGVWKMKITGGTIGVCSAGVNAAANEEQYTVQVLGQTGLNIHSYIDEPDFQPGDPIKISITLSDDEPILDAQALSVVGPLIRVGPPPAAQGEGSILFLKDDGASGDGLANDGVYAATLPGSETENDGTYVFSVFVNGTSNSGEPFAREIRHSVLVGTGTPSVVVSDNPHFIYVPLITK